MDVTYLSTHATPLAEPPHEDLAEESLLGAAMFDQAAYPRAAHVPPAAFYRPANKVVWQSVQRCAKAGHLDNVTVKADLSERHLLDKAGGAPRLVELVGAVPGSSNIAAYADVVLERHQRRETIRAARALSEAALAGDDDAIADAKARIAGGDHARAAGGANLWTLADLYDMPDESAECVVDGLLCTAGLSLMLAAPKVGKSTLARCLAASVATGAPWLGLDVRQGAVLHAALEESPRQVRAHYARMETPRDAPVFVTDLAVKDRIGELGKLARAVNAALVIVDTLQWLIGVQDGNDYAETIRRMEPLVSLARSLDGGHVLCLHHSRKSGGSHGTEALGSTALTGSVDVILSMQRDGAEGERRTIYGDGRDDAHLPKTVLSMDADGRVTSDGTKRERDVVELAGRILDYLEDQSQPVGKTDIRAGVAADSRAVVAALKHLGDTGQITTEGTGLRGSPFLYSVLDPIGGIRNTETRSAASRLENDLGD